MGFTKHVCKCGHLVGAHLDIGFGVNGISPCGKCSPCHSFTPAAPDPCDCGHIDGDHFEANGACLLCIPGGYDGSSASLATSACQGRSRYRSAYRSGPICTECKRGLDASNAHTICDAATGTASSTYWCQDCWRQLNHPVRQRRVARARQQRILEMLDG